MKEKVGLFNASVNTQLSLALWLGLYNCVVSNKKI